MTRLQHAELPEIHPRLSNKDQPTPESLDCPDSSALLITLLVSFKKNIREKIEIKFRCIENSLFFDSILALSFCDYQASQIKLNRDKEENDPYRDYILQDGATDRT